MIVARLEPHYILVHGHEVLHGYVWDWTCWRCGTTGDTSQADGPPKACTNCDDADVRIVRIGDPEAMEDL